MVFRGLALDTVNRAIATLDGAAGKSVNVAKVLKVLGEQPVATGFLGGDRGAFVQAELEARGIEVEFLAVRPCTRQCVTIIDESAGTVTELVEESPAVPPAEFDELMAVVQRRVSGCGAVVMSGTMAPGGPANLYRQCTDRAHESKALAVIDARGAPLVEALAANPDVVKPNRAELADTVGRGLDDETEVRAAARELHERGAQSVVVTAGREPTIAFDGVHFWRITGPSIKAVNPIGSGDAFTAGLVWRLLRGDDLGESCRWATAVGAANALSMMAGEVDGANVRRLERETSAERMRG